MDTWGQNPVPGMHTVDKPPKAFAYRHLINKILGWIPLKNRATISWLPVLLAVLNPFFHDGVIGLQIDGNVPLLRVKHVAQLSKSTVFRIPTRHVLEKVYNFGNGHFA